MRPFRYATIAALTAGVLAVPAAAATWDIDPTHAGVSFSVRHLMVSTVRGEVHGIKGTVEFDGKDPGTLRVDATVDVTTIDTREPKRDNHLKSADFFDVATHPTATFKSKRAEKGKDGKVKLVGDLTMRGVTKEVVLDVEISPAIKSPWGKTVIGATATTTVNRQDYGISWNKTLDGGGFVVGNDVTLILDVEAIARDEAK